GDGVSYIGLTENDDIINGNEISTAYFEARGGADTIRTGGADRGVNLGEQDGAADVVFHQGGHVHIDEFELGVDKIDLTEFPAFISAEYITAQLAQQDSGDTATYIDFGAAGSLYVNGSTWVAGEELSLSDFILPDAGDGVNLRLSEGNDESYLDPATDGTEAADIISGEGGADAINTYGGDDEIYGDYRFGEELPQAPNVNYSDYIAPGSGSDILYGGYGYDYANYDSWQFLQAQGLQANLTIGDIDFGRGLVPSGSVLDPDGGLDQLDSIEGIFGSQYNDIVEIGSAAEMNLSPSWIDEEGTEYFDFYFSGGDGYDEIYSRNGLYTTFSPGDGDGYFETNGGGRIDMWHEQFSAQDGVVDIYLWDGVAYGPTGVTQLSGVTDASGGKNNDHIEGDSQNNGLWGEGGDDILVGYEGDDYLDGGAGDDTFVPGPGFDTVIGDAAGFDILDLSDGGVRAVVDLSTGSVLEDGHLDEFGNPYSDGISDINRVIGTNYDDSITGAIGQATLERFIGGPGDDTIDGQGGNDGVDYRFLTSPFADPETGVGVVVDLAANGAGLGEATDPWGNTDTLLNISRVFGSEYNDEIRGGDEDNPLLIGFEGNDVLEGRGGNDFLFGGEGLDSFVFAPGANNDVIGDYNPLENDTIVLLGSLEVTSVTQIDTDGAGGGDPAVDSTLVSFNDAEGSSVVLSGILLEEQDLLFG
ncbi:calcium-binding protein, partial [Parahaliea maris]|uniref:calcium-binding protein n=1 Tax=Parahaliea maris TaxID=2716870 RepID=UPI0022A6885C